MYLKGNFMRRTIYFLNRVVLKFRNSINLTVINIKIDQDYKCCVNPIFRSNELELFIISDCGFEIADYLSINPNRAIGELGEAKSEIRNLQSAIQNSYKIICLT